MFVLQVYGLTITLGYFGHNMSNILSKTKSESFSLEYLEYIAWCDICYIDMTRFCIADWIGRIVKADRILC